MNGSPAPSCGEPPSLSRALLRGAAIALPCPPAGSRHRSSAPSCGEPPSLPTVHPLWGCPREKGVLVRVPVHVGGLRALVRRAEIGTGRVDPPTSFPSPFRKQLPYHIGSVSVTGSGPAFPPPPSTAPGANLSTVGAHCQHSACPVSVSCTLLDRPSSVVSSLGPSPHSTYVVRPSSVICVLHLDGDFAHSQEAHGPEPHGPHPSSHQHSPPPTRLRS